jgi:uncharacterized SAM-binding protein YcdF (DUF218 family)
MSVDDAAQVVRDYLHMKQALRKCDVIVVLCSIDTRVAEYAAELFNKGYGDWLSFSGGEAHSGDILKLDWGESEAAHFAKIAVQHKVPEGSILIEDKAGNTGENILFTHRLLKSKDIQASSLLLVQKPYMERRSYATFKKQWPEANTEVTVTSPPIHYKNYFNDANPKDLVLNIMVGDMQRIREYPKLGYQIEQDIPEEVWAAYEYLVAAGFDRRLVTTND